MIIIDAILRGICMGLLFALVALGLTIIFGVMDIVNFAHGEFLMIGMYTAYWTSLLLHIDPLITLPASAVVGMLLGLASYYCLVKHLLRGPMIAQLFGTFGLMLFLRYLAQFLFGTDYRIVQKRLLVGKTLSLGPFNLDWTKLSAALLSLLAFLLIYYLLHRTKLGKALRATALNKEAAGYMGMRTERMNALGYSFMIGYPLFTLKGHYFAIATICTSLVLQDIFINWKWVGAAKGIELPILEHPDFLYMQFKSDNYYFYFIMVFFYAALFYMNWFRKSKLGYQLRMRSEERR